MEVTIEKIYFGNYWKLYSKMNAVTENNTWNVNKNNADIEI